MAAGSEEGRRGHAGCPGPEVQEALPAQVPEEPLPHGREERGGVRRERPPQEKTQKERNASVGGLAEDVLPQPVAQSQSKEA